MLTRPFPVRAPAIVLTLCSALAVSGCGSSSDDGAGDTGGPGAAGADAAGDGSAGADGDAAASDEGDSAGDGGDATTDDGGVDATDDGAPPPERAIQAPNDVWTWVDFPKSRCASGTPTGIGINPHAGADDLVIYFQGGGECYSAATCWGAVPAATFLDGYDATTFASFGPPSFALLDRRFAGNPLADTNMVFVPYCTGDLHAGTKRVDMPVNGTAKPTYFWGAKDLELFLARLAPTFPNAKRVYLLGASAGGYATFLSFDRVADAFPGARVDLLDDSGPPLVGQANVNPALGAWGYEAPADCASCRSYPDILAAARRRQPSSRVGFLLFERDTTISVRYGLGLDDYAAKLDAYVAGLADPNMAAYVVKNEEEHVVEKDDSLAAGYVPWVAKMLADDPAWKTETYTHP